MKIKVGMRVRVARSHWWRSGVEATVLSLEPDGRFMVEFDEPGIGFDGGKHLILTTLDVEPIDAE